MRVAPARAALCTLALACASPPPAPSEPARVSVEVLHGFPSERAGTAASRAPVVVLLDATLSMRAPTAQRVSHYAAAQRAATRFANGVATLQPVWLYAVGAEASACQPVLRGTRAESSASRAPLLDEIGRVEPRGEGALAGALDGVRQDLLRAEQLFGSRVVVFSDLGRECGGDLCAAAAQLVEGGAQIDFVAIGDAPVPACLREPAGLAESAPPPVDPSPPVHFRLEVSRPEPMVVGCSDVGGLPVAAPAGESTVVVDLEPPLRVNATFAAGTRHVLQVLDFPALDPPTRHWRWIDLPPVSAGGEAAP